MVGVPMIVVLVVSILRHITPRSETLDQKTYNAFVDDIEQIRFRAWSSTWLLCGCCATVVFFATGLRHLALCMGASSICWICLKVGLAKKSINFEIAAKGFPLVHVWYMLISEFLLFAFAFMEILLLFVKKRFLWSGSQCVRHVCSLSWRDCRLGVWRLLWWLEMGSLSSVVMFDWDVLFLRGSSIRRIVPLSGLQGHGTAPSGFDSSDRNRFVLCFGASFLDQHVDCLFSFDLQPNG